MNKGKRYSPESRDVRCGWRGSRRASIRRSGRRSSRPVRLLRSQGATGRSVRLACPHPPRRRAGRRDRARAQGQFSGLRGAQGLAAAWTGEFRCSVLQGRAPDASAGSAGCGPRPGLPHDDRRSRDARGSARTRGGSSEPRLTARATARCRADRPRARLVARRLPAREPAAERGRRGAGYTATGALIGGCDT